MDPIVESGGVARPGRVFWGIFTCEEFYAYKLGNNKMARISVVSGGIAP